MSTTTLRNRSGLLTGRAVSRLLVDPTIGVIGMLLAAGIIASFTLPVFLQGSNLYNVVESSIVIMILAMGMTVVLISGGIDLSVGSAMGLCAGAFAQTMNAGLPLVLAFVVALGVGVAVGLVNGFMVTKLGLPDFVATLAMLGFASGILYIWTQGVPLTGYMVPQLFTIGGLQPLIWQITIPMIVAAVVAVILGWMLTSTRPGMHMFAVGSYRTGALQSGVRVTKIRVYAYVISGLCAAIAGIIMAGRETTVAADLGTGYEVQAIAAAVIGGATLTGGRGRILGAVLGAVLLSAVTNIIFLAGVPSSFEDIVIGGVLVFAVIANRLGTVVNVRVRQRDAVLQQAEAG